MIKKSLVTEVTYFPVPPGINLQQKHEMGLCAPCVTYSPSARCSRPIGVCLGIVLLNQLMKAEISSMLNY